MKTLTASLLAALAAMTISGCGGGGGASSGGAGQANLPVFLTDSAPGPFDHLWVDIESVHLLASDGSRATVYASPDGEQLDLASLSDASGPRFLHLASAQVPVAAYVGAVIRMKTPVSAVSVGSSTTESRTLAGADVRVDFGREVTPSPMGISLDFNLSRWGDDGTHLSPSCQLGPRPSGDMNRHEFEDYRGMVADLSGTSPDFRFSLRRGPWSMAVVTDASTRIFNSNGQPNAVLANGSRVEVRGTFSASANALVASEVKVEDGMHEGGPHKVRGVPTAIDPVAGSFTLTMRSMSGFVPPNTGVSVQTGASTVFMTDGGVRLTRDEFFSGLSTVPFVEAEGRFDSATNTFMASKCKFESEHSGGTGNGRFVEIKGTALNIEPIAGTFAINVAEYEGFIPPTNPMPVRTTSSTRFRSRDGAMTREAFFAGLGAAGRVKVEGSLESGVLVAKHAKLER